MENKKNNPAVNELTDDQLDQVAGGAINVYDAPSFKQPYYKYTCHARGEIGIVHGRPSACALCKSTNIACEEYSSL